MSDAWTVLTDLSPLSSGDAWEHLNAIVLTGGGSGGETVIVEVPVVADINTIAEMMNIFRVLVNDMVEPYTYSDDNVKTTLMIAARYVNQEINLSTTYTVQVPNHVIYPDYSNDTVFVNFIVLKAACLADVWGVRTKELSSGMKAVAGSASLNTKRSPNVPIGYSLLLEKGPCATYEQLKMEYNLGSTEAIMGVLSPFVSNNYNIL